jgi:pilus assembly protein CpaB
MRRGRVFIYLAIILILALAAVFVVYQRYILPGQGEEAAAPEPTQVVDLVDVIVVTQTTPRGAVLDETVLSTVPIARDLYIQGMFTDMAQVVGRQAKFDLDAGIPITASMLADAAEQLSATGSLWALRIPQGMVAVSIPISRLSSVSYAPRPGDHVSVIMTMMFVDLDSEFQAILPNQVAGVLAPGPGLLIGQGAAAPEEEGERPAGGASFQEASESTIITSQVIAGGSLALRGRTELDPLLNELFFVIPSERQRGRLVSQTFLQDVVVLQIGSFPTREEEEAEKEAERQAAQIEQQQATQEEPAEAAEPEKPKPPDVITLIVRPQDAVTMNYLLFAGAELTLALRATGDTAVESTEAATLQYLLDTYNIPVPAKLPYGLEPRIDVPALPILENDKIIEE